MTRQIILAMVVASVSQAAAITTLTETSWSGLTCVSAASQPAVCLADGVSVPVSGSTSFTSDLGAVSLVAEATYSIFDFGVALSASGQASGGSTAFDQAPVPGTPILTLDSVSARATVSLMDRFTLFLPVISGTLDFELFVGNLSPDLILTLQFNGETLGTEGRLIRSIPFTAGTPVVIDASVEALLVDSAPNDPLNGSALGGTFLSIENLVARDSAGNRLTNWNYVTDSGFRYNAIAAPAAVPEPSSLLLIALPIAAGLLWRRRFHVL